jgi:hypothetical protein
VGIAKGLGQVMLRDDRAGGGGRRTAQKVLGEPRDICSIKSDDRFLPGRLLQQRAKDIGVALAHCSLFGLKHFALGLT